MTASGTLLASGHVTKQCMNGIWKKTHQKFVHDLKGFTKDEEVAKSNKAAVRMANSFSLGVSEVTLRSSWRWLLRN